MGSAPWVLTASIQNGRRRHIRGSFRTKSGLSPNWSSRISWARLRNLPATGEAYHSGLKDLQSHQELSADVRISSFRKTTFLDSQNPVVLSALGFTNAVGKSQPEMFSTRVSNEVPLRCIPATTIAIFFP